MIQYSETPLVERRCDWDQVAVLLDFSYDPWGRRIRKGAYGVDTWFAWDGRGRVIAEALPDGSWNREYFYLEGRPLAMWQAGEISAGGCVPCAVGGVAGFKCLAGGVLVLLVPLGLIMFRRRRRVVGIISGGALVLLVGALLTCDGDCGDVVQSNYYFYHNDHRGAPVFMTDRDARVVWTAMYRPYGEAYVDDDPDGDGTLVTSNLRYPGQYEDTIEDFPEGERLYYNVMRYYDPGLGRYMTAEASGPATRDLFVNKYQYALLNPLSYLDADARDPFAINNSNYDFWRLVWGVSSSKDILIEMNDNAQSMMNNISGGLSALESFTSDIFSAMVSTFLMPASVVYEVAYYYNIKTLMRADRDKFFHCLVSCRSAEVSPAPPVIVGIIKEFIDPCIGRTRDLGDLVADQYGINIAILGGDCFEKCAAYYWR